MDKLTSYRQLIQELLIERANLRSPNDPIKTQTVFDREAITISLCIWGGRIAVLESTAVRCTLTS
jgi:hypothetical protein